MPEWATEWAAEIERWGFGEWALAIGVIAAVAAVVIAVLAWRRPRAAPSPTPRPRAVTVAAANHFPVLAGEVSDHLVGVTVTNKNSQRVRVVGWGLQLPKGKALVSVGLQLPVQSPMPCWVEPGDQATWYFDARQVRQAAADERISFARMRPFVRLASGEKIVARGGVPLK